MIVNRYDCIVVNTTTAIKPAPAQICGGKTWYFDAQSNKPANLNMPYSNWQVLSNSLSLIQNRYLHSAIRHRPTF